MSIAGDKTTIRQFLELLAGAELLSPEDWAAVKKQWPEEMMAADAGEMARALVQIGKLTKYQAASLYQRRPKSLGIGNYVFLDRLGTGGSGSVYKAKHRKTGAIVAVKVLNLQGARSADALKRFQREAETAARLSHPSIVRALESGEAGGQYFTAMEYVEGTDLSTYVKKQGPLPFEQAAHCVIEAAHALAYAHDNGVVHRDIKPANLMLCTDGKIKVLDMGLARLQDPAAEGNEQAADGLTQTGQVMGTVDYMAPEQALHTRHADARADVYSLGCTFYRLVTGELPFDGDSMVGKILAHREHPIPSLRKRLPKVPPSIDVVLQRMLAKKPDDRYQNMNDLAADLQRSLQGIAVAPLKNLPRATALEPDSHSSSLSAIIKGKPPVSAAAAEVPQRSALTARRKGTPMWVLAACGAAVVLVGAAVYFVLQRNDELIAEVQPAEKPLPPRAPEAVPTPSAAKATSPNTAVPAASPTPTSFSNHFAPALRATATPLPTSSGAAPQPPAATPSPTPPVNQPPTITTLAAPVATPTATASVNSVTSVPAAVPTATAAAAPPSTAPAVAEEPKRLSIPETEEIEAALKLVRGELFKDDYAAAKKPEERAALGKKLYDQAPRLEEDRVGRFVMLREARDLGAEGGDVGVTNSASTAAAKDFDVDAFLWIAEACEAAQKKVQPKPVSKATAEALLPIVGEAVREENLEAAERLLNAALASGRKAQDATLLKRLVERDKQFDVEKKRHFDVAAARETLLSDPNDAAANVVVGKYACFVEGKWDEGLAHLSKGNDAVFKELADQGIPAPTTPEARVAVADAWWAKAEKAPKPAQKEFFLGALHYYELAAGEIGGLAKTKTDKRIADARTTLGDAAPPVPTTANLFAGSTPTMPVTLPASTATTAGGPAPPPPNAGGPDAAAAFAAWVFYRNGGMNVRYPQGMRFVYSQSELAPLGPFTVSGVTFYSTRNAVLTEADVDYLASLPWLSEISLSGMWVTNAMVSKILTMPSLQALSVAGCPQIDDAFLSVIAKAGRLQRLTLTSTAVTDKGLAVLGGMRNLQSLYLSNCRITDAGLAHLQNLTELDLLYLDNTAVTDAGLAHLRNLRDLDTLGLSGTQITGRGLVALENCQDLDGLYLTDTKLDDVGVDAIVRLRSLMFLYVLNTGVTDAGVAKISTLQNLSSLNLSGCRITDACVPALARLQRLNNLYIGRTPLTGQALQALQAQLPRCRISTN